MSSERINELQKQIAELKRRWPAHLAPPTLLEQLDELEAELKEELNKATAEKGNAKAAGSTIQPCCAPLRLHHRARRCGHGRSAVRRADPVTLSGHNRQYVYSGGVPCSLHSWRAASTSRDLGRGGWRRDSTQAADPFWRPVSAM